MANESCDPAPAQSEPVKPGTRMVMCVKFGKEMPGLDRIPWAGELGKRVYENVSKEAWKLWIEHSKMIMNEYRLNPIDPNSHVRKFHAEGPGIRNNGPFRSSVRRMLRCSFEGMD